MKQSNFESYTTNESGGESKRICLRFFMLLFLSVQKFGYLENNQTQRKIFLSGCCWFESDKSTNKSFCALSFWNMKLEAQTFTRSFTWLNLLKQKVWSAAKLFTTARLWETFARYCLRNVMRLESDKRLQQFTRWTSAKETNITQVYKVWVCDRNGRRKVYCTRYKEKSIIEFYHLVLDGWEGLFRQTFLTAWIIWRWSLKDNFAATKFHTKRKRLWKQSLKLATF